MKLLSLLCLFLFYSFSLCAQTHRNPENFPNTSQIVNADDSLLVMGFVNAFETYVRNDIESYLDYFFTATEADRFTNMLLVENYPDVDGYLSNDILNRSEVVKNHIDIIAQTCNIAKITYIEKRIGHNDALDGILVQFAFGIGDEWKEQISILFTVFEDQLKVLTLKEEK